jgi:hypothetical protein
LAASRPRHPDKPPNGQPAPAKREDGGRQKIPAGFAIAIGQRYTSELVYRQDNRMPPNGSEKCLAVGFFM